MKEIDEIMKGVGEDKGDKFLLEMIQRFGKLRTPLDLAVRRRLISLRTEKLTREIKRLPDLYPQEISLIDLPIWFMSTKGIKGQKLEMQKFEYKSDGITLEFDRSFSLPTMFTFRVAGILQGLWQEQNYPETFFTSLGEVARRLKIPASGKNLTDIGVAIKQLQNTYITAPFWYYDEKGKKRREVKYRVNIIHIEGERLEHKGYNTLELKLNKYVGDNIKRRHFALLDYDLMNEVLLATAQRLYSIIKRQRYKKWSRSLNELAKKFNLRGKRKKDI